MNRFPLFRCTAAVLAALLSGVVSATPPEYPSKTVSYEDLNLQSKAGIAALYRRIEVAARKVCDQPYGALQLKLRADIDACKADATDQAVLQANLPALSALHLARTGRKMGAPQYADRK